MSLVVDIIDDKEYLNETQVELVEKLLNFVAEKEHVEMNSEVSLSFVSNEEIKELNKTYRDKDMPTDVLSFAMNESSDEEIEIIGADELSGILGDIIISTEKLEEQASEFGHSIERELGFLTVHGFLHLLGYDHMNEEDEKNMFTRQTELLTEFGLNR